ncbi:NAD(P)-dependent alcohol dehydrogenase [Rhodopirellula sp. MGV]|uniref:NADPH-dependent aldehyde reductase Ahr n=1 Tax=Rhodopirellula sp. MGV TaxID=2023130 RepID=UPI000B972AF6|nr:NAD(P)-dependent alcohol dehydrogenase [Rhodopirellula sp. MGV]OYP38166.1 alcohol dehydrogenase [Rhodopirellula sp. MGV]PNY38500.1 NAD(P)-dependent alcohol dehydrogenase [Rhodopirellula baltica]
MFKAYAASSPDSKFEVIEFDPGPLGLDEVEIDVDYCGICHSDLSMKQNDWEMTSYPFVGGHEVVGRVTKFGDGVEGLDVGQLVGVGWTASSCLRCDQCQSGYQNRCPEAVGTIVGRHGGFANRLRSQAAWTIPIPEGVDAVDCGPLFCGGLTVFNPFVENDIKPTGRVAVIGIGGLGHMALQFANAWGCEVTAFSTSPDKESEAREMGAHHFLNSRDPDALQSVAGKFDMVLDTVNVSLDFDAYLSTLRPGGIFHVVGAVPKIEATGFSLLMGQKSISGSPTGAIVRAKEMLEFCARHSIKPMIETFPMSEVNEAMQHLADGKARYRIVLKSDW